MSRSARKLLRVAVLVMALAPVVALAQPGTQPRAIDPSAQVTPTTVQQEPPPPARPGRAGLAVSWAEAAVQAGVPIGVTVRALDADGGEDRTVAGAVTLLLDDVHAF